jgi:hypothetical protein
VADGEELVARREERFGTDAPRVVLAKGGRRRRVGVKARAHIGERDVDLSLRECVRVRVATEVTVPAKDGAVQLVLVD